MGRAGTWQTEPVVARPEPRGHGGASDPARLFTGVCGRPTQAGVRGAEPALSPLGSHLPSVKCSFRAPTRREPPPPAPRGLRPVPRAHAERHGPENPAPARSRPRVPVSPAGASEGDPHPHPRARAPRPGGGAPRGESAAARAPRCDQSVTIPSSAVPTLPVTCHSPPGLSGP